MYRAKEKIKRLILRSKLYKINYGMNQCYVLPYHMIVKTKNGFYPETDIREFENQIKHVVGHYKVVPLDDIIRRMRNGEPLRRRLAITFDDGFKDNYENAYPILKKYGLPAAIFLTTGYIETGTAPWFIKLRYIFMKTDKTHYQTFLNGKDISLQMKTKEQRYAASERLMKHLKYCSHAERLSLMDRLGRELGIHDFGALNNLMLNWSQIREMSEHGISFGAHTVSHPVLASIPIDEAEKEISISKMTIEERIGKPVSSFAYPFGKKWDYKPELFPILEKVQFKCAVTTETGVNNHNTSLFELNRFGPWELRAIE